MIKSIIFDLGNVIVRFDHLRIVKSIEPFTDCLADEIYEQMFASTAVRDYELGKISSSEFFDNVKHTLNLRMEFGEFAEAWNCTFDLNPILPETLFERLSAKYRLLVLSDTNDLHLEFIRQKFPLMQNFDDYVLSYEIGALKPSPQIFRAAIEKATCLPNECFFIDDRVGNIDGARELGIDAVLFETPERLYADLQERTLL